MQLQVLLIIRYNAIRKKEPLPVIPSYGIEIYNIFSKTSFRNLSALEKHKQPNRPLVI